MYKIWTPQVGFEAQNRWTDISAQLNNCFNWDISSYLARHADKREYSRHLSKYYLVGIMVRTDTSNISFSRRTITEWNMLPNEMVQVTEKSRFIEDFCKQLL